MTSPESTFVKTVQQMEFYMEAPVGRKSFFKIIKAVLGLCVVECYFLLGLSDRHLSHYIASLYKAACESNRIHLDKPNKSKTGDRTVKRTTISFNVTTATLYPTVREEDSSHSKSQEHELVLIKKGHAQGTISFRYKWKIRPLGKHPIRDLPGSDEIHRLEEMDITSTNSLSKILIRFKSDHKNFSMHDALTVLDISEKLKLAKTSEVKDYDDWMVPSKVDQEKDQRMTQFLNRLSSLKFYKGLKD